MIIDRMFITPLNTETGMSGIGSTVSFKVDDRMCHMIFTGCQGSVVFKFDPNAPDVAKKKLDNLQHMVDKFKKEFYDVLSNT